MDTPHKFMPSRKDPEVCTFCGGGKNLRFQRSRYFQKYGTRKAGDLVHDTTHKYEQ